MTTALPADDLDAPLALAFLAGAERHWDRVARPRKSAIMAPSSSTIAVRGPGRPRAFDRAEALEQAMRLFWARGFEGASYRDLLAVMKLSQSSLANSFGSKTQLFREAVRHYLAGPGSWYRGTLNNAPDTRSAIAALVEAAAENFTRPDYPCGCLITLSAAHAEPTLEEHQAVMRATRRRGVELLTARLNRGVADGELPGDTDVQALADFYEGVVRGMAIRARDGASRDRLRAMARIAMAAWPGCASSEPSVDQPKDVFD